MTAWDHLPAHLVPAGLYGATETRGALGAGGAGGRGLTFGTPASPETRLAPPAIATVRQAGAYGSELYARAPDGAPFTLPLGEDQLLRLVDEAVAGLRRIHAERRINERRST